MKAKAAATQKRARVPKKMLEVPAIPVSPSSLAEQLHAQSEQIGKVISIVHVCHQACASLYRTDDEEMMVPALVAVMDMLGAVMGRLEEIGGADAEIEAEGAS